MQFCEVSVEDFARLTDPAAAAAAVRRIRRQTISILCVTVTLTIRCD